MSARPVRCPKCQSAIVAQTRPSSGVKRLRAMPDLAYGEPSTKPGYVRVKCPACGDLVDVKGRIVIEQG
jgi:DNA-directed RNA polymerase subunit RPC12/RpoP